MIDRLPDKDQVVQACAGVVVVTHPVLLDAYELASLHEARFGAGGSGEIDCARRLLVRDIDRWVSACAPQPVGAAYLHSETVGMVVDRLAEYCVQAHIALQRGESELTLHYLWQRAAEMSLAYADLAFEVNCGRRRLPDLTDPTAVQGDSSEGDR
ncbi:DUF4254 domain-containing protein [Nocardia macrotermitis]|uniref:DUF4254 domain-containing protein n=1 Tax=Nocardia macrotermitis TaxID=2585198 RepID=A0A7K0D3Z6_9NOCA|nr:DUF4254 domain-containing protein [Nocardia macrotermitis]MQY20439.1 hypothetical protein [Nocardia macrotermitis]